MIENGVITVTCEFCNSSYIFERAEVGGLEPGDQK
jgi:redox-regulated HSP33 family molecular chaperone